MFDKKKYAEKKRIEAKKNGLCPMCGKPVEDGYINCPECRKKLAERAKKHRKSETQEEIDKNNAIKAEHRKQMKSEGRCVYCGKVDSYTMVGRTSCYECTVKSNLRKKKQYKQNPEKYREKKRTRTATLKEKGLCIDCGKTKAQKGRVRCSACLAKRRNYMANRKQHDGMRGLDGMCATCRKNPPKEGFKICESCYENLRQAGLKGAQRNHEIFVEGRKDDPNFKLPFQKTYDWIFAPRRV